MPSVKLYGTPTCPYCRYARGYLRERGIPFEDLDVSCNPYLANDMVRSSGQVGVPVVVSDGKVIVGWKKETFDGEFCPKETV